MNKRISLFLNILFWTISVSANISVGTNTDLLQKEIADNIHDNYNDTIVNMSKEHLGNISISAFPDSVEIFYGNKKYISYAELENIPNGPNKFSFRKKGYTTIDTTFVIRPKTTTFVNITLTPSSEKTEEVKTQQIKNKSSKSKSSAWEVMIMPQIGFRDNVSLGLMVGMTKGANGFYLKGLHSLASSKSDFLGNSDNQISVNGAWQQPNYKSGNKYAGYTFSAGYIRQLWKPIYVYAGAGYSSRKYIKETTEQYKVEFPHKNSKGLTAEVGAIARIKWLLLSCSVHKVEFSYTEFQAGIGVIF